MILAAVQPPVQQAELVCRKGWVGLDCVDRAGELPGIDAVDDPGVRHGMSPVRGRPLVATCKNTDRYVLGTNRLVCCQEEHEKSNRKLI
jgi:hypothetical protein